MRDIPDYLSKFIEPEPMSGCWIWIGGRMRSGYGRTCKRRCRGLAHRAVYEYAIGPIPRDLTLDHLCRLRSCVNPGHLEPVTLRINILRGSGFSAQEAVRTHCPSGHPYDENNTAIYHGSRYCRACSNRPRPGRIYKKRRPAFFKGETRDILLEGIAK